MRKKVVGRTGRISIYFLYVVGEEALGFLMNYFRNFSGKKNK